MGRTIDENVKVDGLGSFHLHQDGATGKVLIDQVVFASNPPLERTDWNGASYSSRGQWYKWIWLEDGSKPVADGGLGPQPKTDGSEPELGMPDPRESESA